MVLLDSGISRYNSLRSVNQPDGAATSLNGQASSGAERGSGAKIAVGVSVIAAIVIACVLALVLYNPERRYSFLHVHFSISPITSVKEGFGFLHVNISISLREGIVLYACSFYKFKKSKHS